MHLFDFKCNQNVFITVSMKHSNILWIDRCDSNKYRIHLIHHSSFISYKHRTYTYIVVCHCLCSSFYSSMNLKLEFIAHFYTFTNEIMNIKWYQNCLLHCIMPKAEIFARFRLQYYKKQRWSSFMFVNINSINDVRYVLCSPNEPVCIEKTNTG